MSLKKKVFVISNDWHFLDEPNCTTPTTLGGHRAISLLYPYQPDSVDCLSDDGGSQCIPACRVECGRYVPTGVLSQGETAATSSSISYYNDFAQSQAELNSLTGYEDGVTYNAIVSTSAVEARNNALVSAPVYNFNGELVANGSADLWDGSLSARINYDQTGTELGGHHVWTGSTSSGEAWAGFELGAGDNAASGGSGRDSNGKWIALKNTFSSTGSNSIYALSSVITVPGSEPEPDPVPPTTVPEPASVVAWSLLGVIGCIGTWWNRRRKVA